MDTIGLFPLGIVVFPGSTFPLHIFEERYRNLVAEVVASRLQFGINLVESSRLHEVGCTVSVSAITEKYADGRMDIAVTGKRRYHLKNFTEGPQSYFVGDVLYFDDEPEEIDREIYREATVEYNRIMEAVYGNKAELVSPDHLDLDQPSFHFSQKSGLTSIQKQSVLEMKSENQRLSYLLEHYRRILPKLEAQERLLRVVRNDGYIRLTPPGGTQD